MADRLCDIYFVSHRFIMFKIPKLLFDSLDSYEHYLLSETKGTDEKGDYVIKKYYEEYPCSCHPETCCHFDGKKSRNYEVKRYLNGG